MARRIPTPDGVALTCLRSVRGWTQKELAEASGTPRTVLSDYETGRRVLSREKLESLAGEMEFGAEAVEAARLGVKLVGLAAEESGSPLDLTAAERRRIVLAALEVAQGAITAVVSTLVRDIREVRARQDRDEAEVLWARLKSLPPQERRRLVEADGEYHAWALCERLCAESEKAAAHDVSRAMELADLALRVADLVPGEKDWRARLQGYAWAHIGNARRVASDLLGADDALLQARELWSHGGASGFSPLEESRLFDLAASLRRDQRRFEEAIDLLDQASKVASRTSNVRILTKKAFTLEQQGDYWGAIRVLREVEPYAGEIEEPRLLFAIRFNLLVNLCHVGSLVEAGPLLEEVRSLAIGLRNDIDLVRVLWLEGRIAVGLGFSEQAKLALDQVRVGFLARGIGYDAALVSLELAVLHLEHGEVEKVKSLARQMIQVFGLQEVHREALAALKLFCEAAEREAATTDLARRVRTYLIQARHDPGLQFGR